MSDPGTPPLDWDGVFDRAHRRLYARLALLSIVGGLAALLLLGGGLSARGAIRWRIGPFASAKAAKPIEGKVKVGQKVKETLEPQPREIPISAPRPNRNPQKPKLEPSEPVGPVVPPPTPPEPTPPPCPESLSDSLEEYDGCPPKPTNEEIPADDVYGTGSTENGGTEYVEGSTDQGGVSDATSEGASTG